MNATPEQPAAAAPPRFRPPFWILLLVLAFVLVPFLFWRGTWFGRPLTEKETGQYLTDAARPRRTQHALVQIGERIVRGDASVKRWYPQVAALVGHESPEIRATAAWVMGQDNQAAEFHAALLRLLEDPDPLVRRNAALALVRFADASGRREIRAMLHSFGVAAPQAGELAIRLKEGDTVNPGTLLARLRAGEEEPFEVRAPLPGTIQQWLVADGARVQGGDLVALLSPAEEQVWEALRALYLIGTAEDLTDVELYASGAEEMSDRVRQQAALTAEAIRRRAKGVI